MPALPSLPPAPGAAWAHALRPPAEVSRGQARWLVAAMAALHLGAGWALLQVPAVRQAVLDAAPLSIELLAPPAPPPEPTPPPPPAQRPPPRVQPLPVLAAPSPAPLPAVSFSVPPPPAAAPEPAVAEAPVVTAAPPAQPAPPAPAPPAPRRIDATAVTYLSPPPVEVPLASRRAGESGVVWLRVVVNTRGLPALVQVQRSSGHARLDAQAAWAMRQARFRPHTEDGTPIEVEVIAPIEYLLD